MLDLLLETCLILSSSIARASPNFGVIGVGSASKLRDSTLSSLAVNIARLLDSFRISTRTLSRLNRNRLLSLYTPRMFLFVKAFSLAEL